MYSDTAPPAVYNIGGRRWAKDEPGFAEAIADAFEQRLRPRCLCQWGENGRGVEMYVARLMDGYIVKRMPNTGSQHSTACMSYEPPTSLTGLGQLIGSAIVEDTISGETTIKLDFPLTKTQRRPSPPSASTSTSSAPASCKKLPILGLLHYLWDQAELTRWHPGFSGRRSWTTVRRHLLLAAEKMIVCERPLLDRLFIPESFAVENRDAINKRRLQHWASFFPVADAHQPLMLMIGEVKEIKRTRSGYKAVIKHVPDQAFTLDDQLFHRLKRCFNSELALWGSSDSIRMVMASTIRFFEAGTPSIMELTLMPVTKQWLPVNTTSEQRLLETLALSARAFTVGLRYGFPSGGIVANAVLTDTGPSPCPLFLVHNHGNDVQVDSILESWPLAWIWPITLCEMPPLPKKRFQALPPNFPARA